MRVIHVVVGKANPLRTANGVNVAVDAAVRTLRQAGLDAQVWAIAHNPRTNLPQPEYPIHFFEHRRGWPVRLDPALSARLAECDRPGTVFHLYGGFLPALWDVARRLRQPYLVMPQGIYSQACVGRRLVRKWLYFYAVEKHFLQQSCGLLLVHENELARWVARAIGGVPRYVVPNGAPLAAGSVPARPPSGRDAAGITRWGYCGRIFDAQKGVDWLVRCFLAFRDQRPGEDHRLSLVGDGPDLPAIRRRYRQAIAAGQLEVHGALFGADKAHQLSRMHYFAHLSRWEGIPLACLEAAAMGVPLLVTPGTNLAADVVRYGAGAVAEGGEQSVVAAMHGLADADYGTLVAGCRRLIAEKYNWQRSAALLAAIYRNVLAL